MIVGLLLLVQQTLAFNDYNNIIINMQISSDAATVSTVGVDEDVISDVEQETFQINDFQLKEAIRTAFGQPPKHVFVQSPAVVGISKGIKTEDLFEKFNWKPVNRKLYPRNARVLNLKTSTVTLLTKSILNRGSETQVFNATMVAHKQVKRSIWWLVSGDLKVSREILFSVLVEDTTLLSFTNQWGQEETHNQNVVIGPSDGNDVELELKSGQLAEITLVVDHGFVEVEIDYVATLDGQVACNFQNKLYDHYFWGFYIKTVLKFGGLPMTSVSTQLVKFEFFANARIKATDQRNYFAIFDVIVPITYSEDTVNDGLDQIDNISRQQNN